MNSKKSFDEIIENASNTMLKMINNLNMKRMIY
jgi:hypothetical protein